MSMLPAALVITRNQNKKHPYGSSTGVLPFLKADYFGALTGFPSSCICVVSVNFSAPAPYVTSTYDAAQPVAGFGALALTDLPPAGTVNSMLLHLLSR
jgi:hypothetical protein